MFKIDTVDIHLSAILCNSIYFVKDHNKWVEGSLIYNSKIFTINIPLKRNLIGNRGSINVGYYIQDETLYLTYAGTQDIEFWLYNTDTDVSFFHGIGLHEGFLKLSEEVELVLFKDDFLEKLIQENKINKVVHCGHSAGGAVAGILALKCYESLLGIDCSHVIIDYGTPRYLKQDQPLNIFPCERLRFQEVYDLIPCTPLTWRGPLPGFEHFGLVNYTTPEFKLLNNPPWYRSFVFIRKYLRSLIGGKPASVVLEHHSMSNYSLSVIIHLSLKGMI